MIILIITMIKKLAKIILSLLGLIFVANCTPIGENTRLPAATGSAKLYTIKPKCGAIMSMFTFENTIAYALVKKAIMLITPKEIAVAFLIAIFMISVKMGTIKTPPPIPENAAIVPEKIPVKI